MNRYQELTKYEFRPPKYSRLWAPILYWVSDHIYLHRVHKVTQVTVLSGGDELLARIRGHDSLLIAPNHSDHADPHALLHINRKFKIPVHFMAAKETFELNRGLNGFFLQRGGVFSVDREGADLRAIKEAMRIVYESQYPLVIFPEGEIYHLNEKLTPLNEGAATIMLKTAQKLKKENSDKGCFIVPTAMRYRYIDDISATFSDSMDRLESHISWAPQRQLDIVERIYKFGEAMIALKEKELLNRTLEGSLPERLNRLRELLIDEIEQKHGIKKIDGDPPEKIRNLRGKIRDKILSEKNPLAVDVAADCLRDLDRLYIAVQLYSYPGQYIRENPTPQRIAETILKFEEDILGEYRIKGRRKCEIVFARPINVYDHLDENGRSTKSAAEDITTEIASAISAVLGA